MVEFHFEFITSIKKNQILKASDKTLKWFYSIIQKSTGELLYLSCINSFIKYKASL